jgi:cysteine-rich repeat protein
MKKGLFSQPLTLVLLLAGILGGCPQAEDCTPGSGDEDKDSAADCADDECIGVAVCDACGNNIVEGAEVCDGTALDGQSCTTQGFDIGVLVCSSDCSAFITGGCADFCGDGIINNNGEQCDGAALGGQDCTDLGFGGGTLDCNNDCTFDTNLCLNENSAATCNNGDDDDQDGLIDCADPDCALIAPCITFGETICNDLGDSDQDGLFDCQDPDCQALGVCTPGAGIVGSPCDAINDCQSTAGNDPFCIEENQFDFPLGYCSEFCDVNIQDCSAGAICLDAIGAGPTAGLCFDSCTVNSDCRPGYTCQDGTDAGPLVCFVGEETICDDGLDDEQDGLIDCADPDCTLSAACAVCGNGVVQGSEQCDDGNLVDGDGCSATCLVEGVTQEVEPNNTSAQATPLGAPDTVGAGSIVGSDVDFFSVDLTAGTVIEFQTSDAGGLGSCNIIDTQFNLFDVDGISSIAVDDDSGPENCSLLLFTVPTSGTYFLRVNSLGNSNIPTYLVFVTGLDLVCGNNIVEIGEQCDDGNLVDGDGCSSVCSLEITVQEVEPNNTSAQATALGAPNTIGAGSLAGADVDFFSVNLTAGSIIEFQTTDIGGLGSCNNTDTLLDLFNVNGVSLLASDDDSGVDRCSRLLFTVPVSGTFFLRVSAFLGANIPAYLLFVTNLVCGNGTLEGLEECDDGNTVTGDGCDAACQFEIGPCAHDICVGVAVNGPLDADGCFAPNDPAGTCAALVCAADSFCCNVTWDSSCVVQVPQRCGITCP